MAEAPGFENRTFRQYDLHKLAYGELRTRFDLTAQATMRMTAKLADAFQGMPRATHGVGRKGRASPAQ